MPTQPPPVDPWSARLSNPPSSPQERGFSAWCSQLGRALRNVDADVLQAITPQLLALPAAHWGEVWETASTSINIPLGVVHQQRMQRERAQHPTDWVERLWPRPEPDTHAASVAVCACLPPTDPGMLADLLAAMVHDEDTQRLDDGEPVWTALLSGFFGPAPAVMLDVAWAHLDNEDRQEGLPRAIVAATQWAIPHVTALSYPPDHRAWWPLLRAAMSSRVDLVEHLCGRISQEHITSGLEGLKSITYDPTTPHVIRDVAQVLLRHYDPAQDESVTSLFPFVANKDLRPLLSAVLDKVHAARSEISVTNLYSHAMSVWMRDTTDDTANLRATLDIISRHDTPDTMETTAGYLMATLEANRGTTSGRFSVAAMQVLLEVLATRLPEDVTLRLLEQHPSCQDIPYLKSIVDRHAISAAVDQPSSAKTTPKM